MSCQQNWRLLATPGQGYRAERRYCEGAWNLMVSLAAACQYTWQGYRADQNRFNALQGADGAVRCCCESSASEQRRYIRQAAYPNMPPTHAITTPLTVAQTARHEHNSPLLHTLAATMEALDPEQTHTKRKQNLTPVPLPDRSERATPPLGPRASTGPLNGELPADSEPTPAPACAIRIRFEYLPHQSASHALDHNDKTSVACVLKSFTKMHQ